MSPICHPFADGRSWLAHPWLTLEVTVSASVSVLIPLRDPRAKAPINSGEKVSLVKKDENQLTGDDRRRAEREAEDHAGDAHHEFLSAEAEDPSHAEDQGRGARK